MRVLLLTILLLILAVSAGFTQQPAYLNTDLTFEQRAADLVARMTLVEKAGQMNHSAPAIDRLGITKYDWWSEGLHGVLADGFTNFPQAIGMAASWDTQLLFTVATAISDEARASTNESIRKGGQPIHLDFWTPNINISRDPRWGRAQETYGEDPYLTSRMGVSLVKGLQGDDPRYIKTISTPKHFAVHSGPDAIRCNFNAKTNMRDLWDTYLPAFEACVREGGAYSVMGAYSALNGTPCCENKFLLDDILRKKWGFKGYVVSDCGAINNLWYHHKTEKGIEEAASAGVKAGCDLACGGDEYGPLVNAVAKGLITEKEVDVSVIRVMTAKMKLGLFDPQDQVKYSKIPADVIRSKEHLDLSTQAARESIVLLKNKDNLLPLDSSKVKSIAVIGPGADIVQLGDYSSNPKTPITILQGLRDKLGADKVSYAKGCSLGLSPMVPVPSSALDPNPELDLSFGVLVAAYFANSDCSGTPVAKRGGLTAIDFSWDTKPANIQIPKDKFSIRWTGQLKAPVTGKYRIGASLEQDSKVFLDGKQIVGRWLSGFQPQSPYVELQAGKSYEIRVEYRPSNPDAREQLMWWMPNADQPMLDEAVETAKKADLAIVVAGTPSANELRGAPSDIGEDEEFDRRDITLPPAHEEMLKAIYATGKPVILVLTGGSPIAVPWAQDHVPSILESWFSGERGGIAVAEVLFGDYNPAGRLPMTCYTSTEDLPDFRDYSVVNRTYRYFKGTPLYPFGYGLSYTSFAYANLKLSSNNVKAGKDLKISAEVRNIGKRAGDEVVQVYLTDVEASAPVPIRKLVGFTRVNMNAGQTKRVSFTIKPAQMAFVNDEGKRVLEPGKFKLTVGGSQGDSRSKTLGAADVLLGEFSVKGETLNLE